MKTTRPILVCALAIAAVVMAIFCVQSVTTPIKFEDTRAQREVTVIKHLVDLRTAEVEYHHQNGVFTASMDTLLMFLKTAPKKEVMKEGSLTDKQLEAGLTEHKAVNILAEAKKKALKKSRYRKRQAKGRKQTHRLLRKQARKLLRKKIQQRKKRFLRLLLKRKLLNRKMRMRQ